MIIWVNKIMFKFIKKTFIALLSFSGSLAITFISLNSEPCVTRPMLIDLNPGEHYQRLHHYRFMVSLGMCSE